MKMKIFLTYIFIGIATVFFSCSSYAFDNKRAEQLLPKVKDDKCTSSELKEALKLAAQFNREAGDYMVKAANESKSLEELNQKLTDFNRANIAGDTLSALFIIVAMSSDDTEMYKEYLDAREYFKAKKEESIEIADKKFGIQ